MRSQGNPLIQRLKGNTGMSHAYISGKGNNVKTLRKDAPGAEQSKEKQEMKAEVHGHSESGIEPLRLPRREMA